MSNDNTILKINNIEVKYHEVILVIKGVSIVVPDGGIVALLGANGAGKSTILKAISGLLKHEDGQVTDGSIEFLGERIDRMGPEKIAKMGIVQVIEGRRVFEHLRQRLQNLSFPVTASCSHGYSVEVTAIGPASAAAAGCWKGAHPRIPAPGSPRSPRPASETV